mmetsp:Transcript_25377/g.31060  ORF Transcript_25377/g.31060 Transcript_25377/m.31060 type:complete len:305 (-) Transcript_25377:2033-2947(-)
MDNLDAELAAFEAEINSIDTNKETASTSQSEQPQEPEPIQKDNNVQRPEKNKKRKRAANGNGSKVEVVAAASAGPTINKRYLQSMVNVYEAEHEKVENTASPQKQTHQSQTQSSYTIFPPTFSHSEAKDFMHQQSAYDYEKTQQRRRQEQELKRINSAGENNNHTYTAGPQPQAQDNKQQKFIREIGGEVWEDKTLQNWPDNDYRIFVGNLGKEINQEHLGAAFKPYPSYNMCRVVQNKESRQSKGYGFVSFGDPKDMLRAIREKNGAYLGHRPMKIKRGKWEERDIKHVRKRKKSEKRERRTY